MTWDPNVTTVRIATRGRVTGREHTVTTWFACAGGAVYVAARGGLRSDWVRNVLAAPAVELRRRRRSWTAAGALVDAAEEVRRAVEAFADKYARHPEVIGAWRADPPTFVRFRWTE
ncbi:deazaflavin-dependent oxidoreductase (nitroreductase family) [Prauserella isguenensis]|uniref:Deazaflavin-dependent oxidoreductase (Nitroreductase family) n=1 Tax=Prauserella isguenensis TaxID=1470180 RepID=A0A839RYA4_9PSEU|nr:deazaflavin-dependent oxidoreductase (nitroreductase family) [Prauserella isguenensis]